MSFLLDPNVLALFSLQESSLANPTNHGGAIDSSAIGRYQSLSPVNTSAIPPKMQTGPRAGIYARTFDGVNNGFEGTTQDVDFRPHLQGSHTVELVMRSTTHTNRTRVVFQIGLHNDWFFRLQYNPVHGTVAFRSLYWATWPTNAAAGGGASAFWFDSLTTVTADTWLYVACRFTKTGGTGANSIGTGEMWIYPLTPGATLPATPTATVTPFYVGGATSWYPHFGIGCWPTDALNTTAKFAGSLAGIRCSNVARTLAELRASYSSFATGAATPDTTRPTIANISPAAGTTISASQPITFDVLDETAIRRTLVLAKFPSRSIFEVVHDGDGFGPLYDASPNTRTAIAGGHRFTILRRGGWPSPPSIIPHVIDTSGNEAL